MAYRAQVDDQTHRIELHATDQAVTMEIDGQRRAVDGRAIRNGTYSLLIHGRSYVADVAADGDHYIVSIGGTRYRIRLVDERRAQSLEPRASGEDGGRREVHAMMSGKVVDVLVQVGARVERDQGLLIIEAMKMENEIKSPTSGEVKDIAVRPGQAVETGALLVVIE